MNIISTPPRTCADCGCAAEQCECWDPTRPEEVILRANHILGLLKQAEDEKAPAAPALKVGMWVRVTSGTLWRAEGRIASMDRRHVRLVQLNGTVLTVPREIIEEAQFGTNWASLIEGGQ